MIPGLETSLILNGRAARVSIHGQVPADAMSGVSEELFSVIKEPCRYLIIDCSRMTAPTEVNLGLGLVAYYASIMRQRGGELLIVLPPPEVMSRLEGNPPMNVVRLTDSLEEAVEYVRERLRGSDAL